MSPKCLCQVEMLGFRKWMWHCPQCGRLLYRDKNSGYQSWYVPEASTCGCFNRLINEQQRGD